MINSIPEPRKARLISILNRMNLNGPTDLTESNLIDECRRITLDDLECKLADIAIREAERTTDYLPGFMAMDCVNMAGVNPGQRWSHLRECKGKYETHRLHLNPTQILIVETLTDPSDLVLIQLRIPATDEDSPVCDDYFVTKSSFTTAASALRDRVDVPYITGLLEGLT